MSDEIAARLRALLPVASSIDRLLISVTDLRALLDELARLRDLFRLDGEQHANHIKELTKAHEARITKYADELARLRAPVEGEAGEMVKRLLEDHRWAAAEVAKLTGKTCNTLSSAAADLITRQDSEIARLRAPVEGEAGEMVQWLSALNHISLEDCFLQSPMFAKAADLITRQAASLRETVEVIERIASQNLHAEITDTDPDERDWLYAYEQCVKEARAWLAKHGGDSDRN
jgi:hypothetical protein